MLVKTINLGFFQVWDLQFNKIAVPVEFKLNNGVIVVQIAPLLNFQQTIKNILNGNIFPQITNYVEDMQLKYSINVHVNIDIELHIYIHIHMSGVYVAV